MCLNLRGRVKNTIIGAILALATYFSNSGLAFALTPIARWDVVPHQRISAGETFNLGVVAFSKEGIARVEFTVSGQGYSGNNPLVARSMTYNERTDVHEYWVPLRGSDFKSDGPFSVKAQVFGKDGGKRSLEPLEFVANATGNLPQHKAWVSNSGIDSSGALNTRSQPFQTVAGAVEAIQKANGGLADGGIIYFMEGEYALGKGATTTEHEWLTLSRDSKASIKETIIENGGSAGSTRLLKVDGLTITSSGQYDYVFRNGSPQTLWINGCRVLGSDRWTKGTNPIAHGNSYHTNSYIYNVDRGVYNGILARGLTIKHIGEDAFQNFPFVVNVELSDQDPGNTYWHADAYQSHGEGPENRIIYNFHATDLHYQGLFLRATKSPGRNNAFVNIFMEMREPGRPGRSGGSPSLKSGAMNGPWDHAIVWHCTFPKYHFYTTNDTAGFGFTNSSFIGNVFAEFRDYKASRGSDPLYAMPGNNDNNDFLYNHFMGSYTDVSGCSGNPQPKGCPHWNSKSPDSDSGVSQSVGANVLDLDPNSNSFGHPLDGYILVDRLPFTKVPGDIFGNPRDSRPDVGAIEKRGLKGETAPMILAPPTDLRIEDS